MIDDIKDANFVYDKPWDAQLETGCKCDPGFRGADCSLSKVFPFNWPVFQC